MRKINTILIIAFGLLLIFPIKLVSAKTLGDIKKDVEAAEKALKENKQQQTQTAEEMQNIQETVRKNLEEMDNATKEIARLDEEIDALNIQIEEKANQIKKLLNFVQKANGNNAYLEYISGAEDFTDLIYRTAIAEQLSKYNDKLIDDYTALIEENTEASKELEDRKVDLAEQRTALEEKYKKYSSALREIEDAEPTLEEDVKLQRELYDYYAKLGCKLDEEIEACWQKLLPSTSLYRPLEVGYFGGPWGPRCYWLRGKQICDFHKGVDLNKSGSAVPIYSAGVGRVAAVVKVPNAWSCGGQVVFISHNVGGKNYTTVYMHLRKVFVNVDDFVDRNTVIAYMGGSPGIETWDTCTTGQHLHFAVSEGIFTSWAKAKSTLVDPTTVINFPPVHTTWYNRTTKY